ncbi:MAG: dihydroxyacetone kinase subunit L [Verrucomicrobiae bacterium]|nr:dihydroxyacetone kinase subunit L [Verrucomicrobiae bacterium]MCP5541296.1 dihydroxyacetone kinase subunit L [Akkermansiaceae bacterium]MCP5550961.1 dihydroxyacetone kinase subunit L [Akkermansiaceae bacterium]
MPKETLSPAECRDMMLAVADAIIAAEPVLTDADRALGDGDHGIGMSRGMNAVKDKLAGQEFESVEKVFTTMGMAMMSSMGGASGAVFGTLFRAGGKALTGAESFGSRELAAFFTAASEGVQTRGGAKVGDKTMVDSLAPAAEKAVAVAESGLPEAIAAVADAAESGKEASKDMIATMGRAKTLGEKTLGHPDAGAVSVTIILSAMRDYIVAA